LLKQVTEASITYEFMSLSEMGNSEIAAMSEDSYAHKLARWTQWING
jgi:hypothetical protein